MLVFTGETIREEFTSSSGMFFTNLLTGYVFALYAAGPFGLLIGAIGGIFLRLRGRRLSSLTRLRLEAMMMGALSGAALSLIWNLLGWALFEGAGLMKFWLPTAGIGALCALALTLFLKRDLSELLKS